MLNSESYYADLGYKAGLAMRQRDISRNKHFSELYRRGRALETIEDRGKADKAYLAAYQEQAQP